MADRESILAWLGGAKYRIVADNHPAYRIVLRLIEERRAEWTGAAYRVRAKSNVESKQHHSPKQKRGT